MPDVLILPGALYGPYSPLPWFAAEVAERRGGTLHRHTWSRTPDRNAPEEFVRGEVVPLIEGRRPLVIAKSLGTLAAGLCAERALPAVWLTPLLTAHGGLPALAGAPAPFLLVGGTADPSWDGALAHRLTPHVLEVEGADHAMAMPGPVRDTVAVLARVVDAVEDFLEAIAWPS
ncbi:alpha/beta hydrolase [Actinoplanes sp. NPDC049265]|uniref:alpha/beta hydrolase n=1 Tax=Actinoplanes sp. NPDC049265 TaxID=3363902 RepID=UPI00371B9E84